MCCNINKLFAMPLELILREIRFIFNQTYLFIHYFAGKGIIYHLIAYDLKIEENVRNLCFGCHGNQFVESEVVF